MSLLGWLGWLIIGIFILLFIVVIARIFASGSEYQVECLTDLDCDVGDICLLEKCVVGCRDDDGCPGNQICTNWECTTGCRVDGSCLSGECLSDQCTPAVQCQSKNSCTGVCINGLCTASMVDLGCFTTPMGYINTGTYNINSEAELASWYDGYQSTISFGGLVRVPAPVYLGVAMDGDGVTVIYSSVAPSSTTDLSMCSMTGSLAVGTGGTWRIYRYYPTFILGPSTGGSGGTIAPITTCGSSVIRNLLGCSKVGSSQVGYLYSQCTSGVYTAPVSANNTTICTSPTQNSMCPEGYYTGLSIRSGLYVEQVQGVCSDGSVTSPPIGSGSSKVSTLLCGSDQAVIGYIGQQGDSIDGIQVVCGYR